jgi:hypothetical protein
MPQERGGYLALRHANVPRDQAVKNILVQASSECSASESFLVVWTDLDTYTVMLMLFKW